MSLDAAAPEAVQAFAEKKATGVGGVKIAKATQRFKAETQAVHVESQKIKYKDDKTFYLKDGIWVDSEYREGHALKEIVFNSKQYYQLITAERGIAKYLSVARNLIIHFRGVAYKITDTD
jgi:hypothetical protein